MYLLIAYFQLASDEKLGEGLERGYYITTPTILYIKGLGAKTMIVCTGLMTCPNYTKAKTDTQYKITETLRIPL